ncbi:hypothetical protein D3C81_1653340 [compost metagenome]
MAEEQEGAPDNAKGHGNHTHRRVVLPEHRTFSAADQSKGYAQHKYSNHSPDRRNADGFLHLLPRMKQFRKLHPVQHQIALYAYNHSEQDEDTDSCSNRLNGESQGDDLVVMHQIHQQHPKQLGQQTSGQYPRQ